MGKMDFYLEALDRDIKKAHENPSVGMILCKNADTGCGRIFLEQKFITDYDR